MPPVAPSPPFAVDASSRSGHGRWPALIGQPLLLFAINIVALSLLRVAFWLAFRPHAIPSADLAHAFYLGLKFDARLAAILSFPLLFFSSAIYVAIVETLLAIVYAADFASYAYIRQRLNADLIEFLRNPLISLHMAWESYHVVYFAIAVIAFIALIVALAKKTTDNRQPRTKRIATAIFFLACIYGELSRYPLRWSDAFFSTDSFVGELALNPVQYLFETMREEPPRFDVAAVRRLYPLMTGYLGVDHPDPRTLTLLRTPPLFPQVRGTPNVVVIQLESFAAFKSSLFGNRMNACPNFDAVARNGILFTNAYSPSEKTARALFAVVFGIPDVSPWQASAHNPLTVDQSTIVNAFTGYDKMYFLGGSANWSNIRGMLEHNIAGLRMYEEGSYKAKPVDVWGISDDDLFLAANDVFRNERRPFFAIVQTSGNHRPYTIPADAHGFRTVHEPDGVLHANGFESNEEFNGFRLLDHSLGMFFDAARKEPYFANTIFVLYGDHGTRTGAPARALALGDLALLVYHVPLVIYAPFLQPRRIEIAASHVDILPTIASLCGRPYRNQTLGIDLFDPDRAKQSAAFVFTTFHEPPSLGVVQGSRYTMVKSGETESLAEAFYEFSRWLLFHNAPSPKLRQ
ncbi:MAG TPA: sulfatase-like hydrolase/transferase [Thermoanaerobaculia bacterium]|nr:sulfatase-like hydrolase/transferase [Thermoanaerobaculia bacterium]